MIVFSRIVGLNSLLLVFFSILDLFCCFSWKILISLDSLFFIVKNLVNLLFILIFKKRLFINLVLILRLLKRQILRNPSYLIMLFIKHSTILVHKQFMIIRLLVLVGISNWFILFIVNYWDWAIFWAVKFNI